MGIDFTIRTTTAVNMALNMQITKPIIYSIYTHSLRIIIYIDKLFTILLYASTEFHNKRHGVESAITYTAGRKL